MAGPYNSSVCIHFIVLCHISNTAADPINIDLNYDLLEILSINNIDVDDEMDKLQNLAKKYYFNLYICIINQNEKKFYYLNATSVQENQQWPLACLIYNKRNRSFYPFFIRDNNKKYHTIFPLDDTHTLRLFEDLTDSYNWSDQFHTIQQLSDQDTSVSDEQNIEEENAVITNVNLHTGLYNT